MLANMVDTLLIRVLSMANRAEVWRKCDGAGEKEECFWESGWISEKLTLLLDVTNNQNGLMTNETKNSATSAEGGNKNINFAYKGIRAACSPEVDMDGRKRYRTVFRADELSTLYVDTEFVNLQYGRKTWKARLEGLLFGMEGEQATLVAHRAGELEIPSTEAEVNLATDFRPEDCGGMELCEGAYRVQMVIDGVAAVSDEICVVEARGGWREYMTLLGCGLNRTADAKENLQRMDSYAALKHDPEEKVCLFLLAENKLGREWTYEFELSVATADGVSKGCRTIKGNQFVQNRKGQKFIYFVVEVADGLLDFWLPGHYVVRLFCFGEEMVTLPLEIGEEDALATEQEGQAAVEETAAVEEAEEKEKKPRSKEEILAPLNEMVGLRKVKEELTHLYELSEFAKLRQENGFNDEAPCLNMVFMGQPGTGKHSVAELTGKIFAELGVLRDGRVRRYRREDLSVPGYAAESQLVEKAVKASAGGVLLIEDADELCPTNDPNDAGIRILTALTAALETNKEPLIAILAGDGQVLRMMLEGIPDLQACFPNELPFENYTADELVELTRRMLERKQFTFTPEAERKFFDMVRNAVVAGETEFSNGLFVEERLNDAAARLAKRLMSAPETRRTREEMMRIREEDIVPEERPDPKQSIQKFKDMVASKQLKTDLIGYINYVYFIRERQRHGFADVIPPLHMIFMGHPGTGKTTVAQMLAEILESAGVLATRNVTVRGRGELVGDGSVPPQQIALYAFEQARGGLLFLENAQSFFQDAAGAAVLSVILGQLSETENGDTVVVLSGDPVEMEKALGRNPKIRALFPYQFNFEDYTPEELLDIAERKITEREYALDPQAREAFRTLIDRMCEENDKHLGNALFVEKMVDKAIRSLSVRTMKIRNERELTREELTTLTAADIPSATTELPNTYRNVFDEKGIAAALKELDHMVGQQKMKKQIHDFVDLARHYNQQGVKLNTRLSLQWCFTGNSGMGKGTVARIIARIYKAMGIIDRETVVNFKVDRLAGMTEEEVAQAVGGALAQSKGGLFFYDEDSNKLNEVAGLRDRARAVLVNQLATQPGAYTVIYAKQEAPRLILNDDVQGVSDMINVLEFEDYTQDELMEILKRDLATEQCRMTRTAQQHMASFIALLVENKKRNHASARLIKLVAEMMVRNRIQRLTRNKTAAEREKTRSVTKQDVEMFTPEFLAGMTTERKTIGYKR